MATANNFVIENGLTVNTTPVINSSGYWIGPGSGLVGATGPTGPTGATGAPPESTIYTAASISLTGGVYVSGTLSDIQSFNDGNYYTITDGSGTAPAWQIDVGFTGVTKFNRVNINLSYTSSSGHTIYIQVYNYNTSTWDNVGSYSGLGGFTQFALELLDSTHYISGEIGRAHV